LDGVQPSPKSGFSVLPEMNKKREGYADFVARKSVFNLEGSEARLFSHNDP
jgi:hypothetical protein